MTQELVKGLPYQMTPFAIFDLDGTLIDSMPVWSAIDRQMLTDRGVVYDLDAATEATKALSIREAMQYWVDHFGIKDTVDKLVAEADERVRQAYATTVPLKNNVLEYLDHLKKQGVRMCVATSTTIPLVEVVMRRLELWDRFEFVLSAHDVGRGKEFPDVYLEAARRLGAKPGQCTVYEDTLAAVRTAHAAGFRTVGVADSCGVTNAAETSAAADCYVLDFGQLME